MSDPKDVTAIARQVTGLHYEIDVVAVDGTPIHECLTIVRAGHVAALIDAVHQHIDHRSLRLTAIQVLTATPWMRAVAMRGRVAGHITRHLDAMPIEALAALDWDTAAAYADEIGAAFADSLGPYGHSDNVYHVLGAPGTQQRVVGEVTVTFAGGGGIIRDLDDQE